VSRAKILPEHAAILRQHHAAGSALIPPLAEYVKVGMTQRRHAWDALHAAKFHATPTSRDIYQYANDDHIDTILRSFYA
jgi:hypothetical protein